MGKIDGGLRALFRESVPGDWTSIESGSTGGGIPDSNYCLSGVEGWLEYKQTGGWSVTLKPEQVGWIARRVRNGGRVWVAVRQRAPAGPRREARDALWLFPGGYAAPAKTEGLRGAWASAPDVHTWHHGPQGWDWQAIRKLLRA
jgi:hypothetical protein